ncbi:hypothetical protein H257_06652 [Aphanomyces astaci]|uniref:SMP-30/Gluconolactonase/LRE-like region domain-containing protein n=1 Tax=Aphanomyces astaci TaxID=112090 RepID=W4GKY6_APHAT|nr:hypothetical protein H257_06652 [Aphanomyces astaci]ETV80342.1 hypothetical protein H257_06652 [Aphanomyces astaci]|eukprot:XP_009830266.1 hypothetical protein H257_06652 [Aphanomyces astaci]
MAAEVQDSTTGDGNARSDGKRRRSVITTFRTEQAAFRQRRIDPPPPAEIPQLQSSEASTEQNHNGSSKADTATMNALRKKSTQGKQINKIKVIPVDVDKVVASHEAPKKPKSPKTANHQQSKRSSLIEKARSIRRLEEKVSFITRRRLFFKRMRQLILYVFAFAVIVGIGLYTVLAPDSSITVCCSGQVTTIAQGVRAMAMAFDGNGTLYIADAFANKIFTWNGTLNEFAGSTVYAGDVDGTLSNARFSFPTGIAVDVANSIIYVASRDYQSVRSIQNGTVSTKLAQRDHRPAQPTALPINVFDEEVDYYMPISVAVDDAGNVFIGSGAMVERIDAVDGSVAVLAGNGWRGYADGSGATARFRYVRSLVVDPSGLFVYVADMYNKAIRRIDVANDQVTTLTAKGFAATSTTRRADCFQFDRPYGVALGGNGTELVVADSWNNTVVVFDINGTYLRAYGTSEFGSQDDFVPEDPTLHPLSATFGNPATVAVDANGTIYVGDAGNRLIRKIQP